MKRMLIFLMGCLIINSSLGVGCGEEERVIPPRPQQLGNEFPKRKRYIPLHRLAKVPRTADATLDILVPSEADLAEAGPSTSAAGPEDTLGEDYPLEEYLPTKNRELWVSLLKEAELPPGRLYPHINPDNFEFYSIGRGKPASITTLRIASVARYALKHGLIGDMFMEHFDFKNLRAISRAFGPKAKIGYSERGVARWFAEKILPRSGEIPDIAKFLP